MTAGEHVAESAPLCFGQLAAWTAGRKLQGPWRKLLNFAAVWPIPEGNSRASVKRALGTLTKRHETLRTRYLESESLSGPRQVVLEVPRLEVTMLKVDNEAWASDELMISAPKSITDFFDCSFEITEGLNWKAAIVEVGGRPSYVCFVCHHIVADMSGVVRLGDELAAILDGTDTAQPSATRMQPRTLAEIERSRWERDGGQSTLDYWRSILCKIPNSSRQNVESDLDQQARRISRSLLRTPLELARLNRLASSHKVPISSLVLGLMLAGLSRSLPAVGAIPVNIASWNRFSPQLQSLVGTVSLHVPILVEVTSNSDFNDLALKAHRATLKAYRHASYDCTEVVRETESIAAAREIPLDIPYGFAAQLDQRVHRPREKNIGPRDTDELVPLPALSLSDEQRRFPPILEIVIRADDYLDIWMNADSVNDAIAHVVLRTIRQGLGVLLTVEGANISVQELHERVDDSQIPTTLRRATRLDATGVY